MRFHYPEFELKLVGGLLSAGDLVREVRKSRGETMVQFAAQLGLRHSTISQYEAGNVAPSASVLMNMYRLAVNAGQKARIRALLGESGASLLDKEDAFQVAASKLNAEFQQILADVKTSPAARDRFRKLAVEIIARPSGVPMWLCDLMQIWLRVEDNPEALRQFEEVAHSARLKLANFERQNSAKR